MDATMAGQTVQTSAVRMVVKRVGNWVGHLESRKDATMAGQTVPLKAAKRAALKADWLAVPMELNLVYQWVGLMVPRKAAKWAASKALPKVVQKETHWAGWMAESLVCCSGVQTVDQKVRR